MKNLYIVAHTQSIHHIEKKVGGWYDTGLTDHGRQQALSVANFLEQKINGQPVKIFSSDLKRAAETASIISKVFKQKVALDSNLRELSYGKAEGRDQFWLSERISYTPEDGNRLDHKVCHGAESRREIGTRLNKSIERIQKEIRQNAIIVTHGFALTFIIMSWLKVPVSNMDYCNFYSKPGGITLLQEDNVFNNRSVRYINDIGHLKCRSAEKFHPSCCLPLIMRTETTQYGNFVNSSKTLRVHIHLIYLDVILDEVALNCSNQYILLLFHKFVSHRSVKNNQMLLAVLI